MSSEPPAAVEFSVTACKDNSRIDAAGAVVRDELRVLLESLESEMRRQGRWEQESPPAEALRSTEPFAVDTLTFDQWLQWILLPRMHELLVRQLPLPANCAIQPMAEEVYGEQDPTCRRIVMIVGEIDALLTEHQGGLN
jgi:uncharacterized protein YqcC (DUF446 family)